MDLVKSKVLLASSGIGVKFYRWPQGTLEGSWFPHNSKSYVKSISWCDDGVDVVVVSGTSKFSEPPVIITPGNVLSQIDIPHVDSAAFAKTEKCIVLGTNTGEIFLYDPIRRQIMHQRRKLPAGVRFLEYGARDTAIAAGCRNGHVYLISPNNSVTANLVVPNSNHISALCFHPRQPHILAAGSAEGTVAVWDSNTGFIKLVQKTHYDGITDVSFSPTVNAIAIVGADKKLVVTDFCKKEPILTKITEHNIVSVAYGPCGNKMALASTEGKIFIYDMRRSVEPIFISSHGGLVTKIVFQTPLLMQEVISEENSNDMNSDSCGGEGPKNDRIPAGMDSFKIANEVVKEWVDQISAKFDGSDGSEISDAPVNNESEMAQIKKEMLEALKKLTDQITEKMNSEFLKVRMALSREFVHMEYRMNYRWHEFSSTLMRLVAVEKPSKGCLDRPSNSGTSACTIPSKTRSSRNCVNGDKN